MIKIGILSDTHLTSNTLDFSQTVQTCFADCNVIIHAGDLTDTSILQAFEDKEIYAVHGNMCNPLTEKTLPEHISFTLAGYSFGLCHGAGTRHNIEDRMYDLFPLADCIIYGHTHIPVCHKIGTTLLINPGSFQSTGRYGAPGTYCLLTIDDKGLHAKIHDVPQY